MIQYFSKLKVFCFVSLCASVSALKGFDFEFISTAYLAPRAVLTTREGDFVGEIANDQFTFCLYAFIETHPLLKTVDLLSFSSERAGEYNELLLEAEYGDTEYTSIYINGEGLPFMAVPPLDQWTHLCVTWTNLNGEAKFYVDGEYKDTVAELKEGYSIEKMGYFMLGQDQDYYNGYFQPEDGIRGRITQFHMWDRVLTEEEVKQAQTCELDGDLISWDNSTWGFFDAVELRRSTAPCGQVECKKADTITTTDISTEATTEFEPTTEMTTEATTEYEPTTEMTTESETTIEPTTEPTTKRTTEMTTTEKSCMPTEHPMDSPLDHFKFKKTSEKAVLVAQFQSTINVPALSDISSCAWLYADLSKFDKVESNFVYRPKKNGATKFRMLVAPDGKVSVSINGTGSSVTGWKMSSGWEHVCITWSGTNNGELKVYANGKVVHQETNFKAGFEIPGSGWFYLLQVQTEPMSSDDITSNVALKASDYNVWNRILTANEVTDVFCLGKPYGNFINWSQAKWKLLPYRPKTA